MPTVQTNPAEETEEVLIEDTETITSLLDHAIPMAMHRACAECFQPADLTFHNEKGTNSYHIEIRLQNAWVHAYYHPDHAPLDLLHSLFAEIPLNP